MCCVCCQPFEPNAARQTKKRMETEKKRKWISFIACDTTECVARSLCFHWETDLWTWNASLEAAVVTFLCAARLIAVSKQYINSEMEYSIAAQKYCYKWERRAALQSLTNKITIDFDEQSSGNGTSKQHRSLFSVLNDLALVASKQKWGNNGRTKLHNEMQNRKYAFTKNAQMPTRRCEMQRAYDGPRDATDDKSFLWLYFDETWIPFKWANRTCEQSSVLHQAH